MTVLIMRVHFSGEHGGKVPRWLRKVVLVCLARVVRMHKTAAETCKVSVPTQDWLCVIGARQFSCRQIETPSNAPSLPIDLGGKCGTPDQSQPCAFPSETANIIANGFFREQLNQSK